MINLSSIVFNVFDEAPCTLKDPIKKETKKYTVDECCDYLIKYREQPSEAQSLAIDACKLWWARKWYVPLDYYLLSTTDTRETSARPQGHDIPFPSNHAIPPLGHMAKEQLSPIQAIFRRKTYREFSHQTVPSNVLAALLQTIHEGTLLDGIWDYYVVVVNVKDLNPGIYRYDAIRQELQLVAKKSINRDELANVFCGSDATLTAAFCLTLAINVKEAQVNYPYSRALREAYIDAGRIAGRVLIKGIQHNIGGVPFAVRDTLLCELLTIDSNQIMPIHSVIMGGIRQ